MGRKSKLGFLGAALLTGLAFGTKAYAQDSTKTNLNRIYSRNYENSAAGEGIFLKDFVPYDVYDSLNLKDFNLYAQRGNISYDAIDTKQGLANAISFLRGRTQTPEVRASISNLERLSRSVPETDNASLEALRRAVSDEVITSQEMSAINPGTYVIMARSPAVEGLGAQSVPIIVNRKTRPVAVKPDTVRVPVYRDRTITDTLTVRDTVYEGKGPSTRFFIDGFAGDNRMIGGEIGMSYGAFGLSLNGLTAGDELVESRTVPLSNGRVGAGTKEEVDYKSVGATAEFHQGPFFVGVGANKGFFTTIVNENILSATGDTLAHNLDPRSDRKWSYRFLGGVELPLTDRLSLRALAGHDTRKGLYGGLGASFRLNRRQHR